MTQKSMLYRDTVYLKTVLNVKVLTLYFEGIYSVISYHFLASFSAATF